MTTVEELGRRAKQASRQMNRMGTKQKNQILALAAQALVDEQEEILKANAMDIEAARKKNMPGKRSSQSNPEANLRNRQTAVACMADPPEGRHLWHFTDRRHHLSAAGGFSEAAFYGRNTALNHIKKECALAHSRAEARLLWQPSTSAPSAHPCGAFLSYGNEVSYTRTKSLAAAVDCTQPYRRLFIL